VWNEKKREEKKQAIKKGRACRKNRKIIKIISVNEPEM